MNRLEFRAYLQSQRRKDRAIEDTLAFTADFETFLSTQYAGHGLDRATPEALESYVAWLESEPGSSAAEVLWGLRFYFDFCEDQELSNLAGAMRAERVKRKPFYLGEFRGIRPAELTKLNALYIENVDQMLDAARTPRLRQALAEQSGLTPEKILEFVTLSDLSRLQAVRGVRARLYFEAGLTPEIIATWEPEPLHAMLSEFVTRTGFEGVAPQLREVQKLVADARKLPILVQY